MRAKDAVLEQARAEVAQLRNMQAAADGGHASLLAEKTVTHRYTHMPIHTLTRALSRALRPHPPPPIPPVSL